MENNQESQATRPSTQQNTNEDMLNADTNTSIHNSVLSRHGQQESFGGSEQGGFRENVEVGIGEEKRFSSQRIVEGKRQGEIESIEVGSSKSEGQLSNKKNSQSSLRQIPSKNINPSYSQDNSLLLQDQFNESLNNLNPNHDENVPIKSVINRGKEVVSQSDDYLLDFGSQQQAFNQLDRKKSESVYEIKESQGENSSHKSHQSSHSSRGIRHVPQVPVQKQSLSHNSHNSFSQVCQNEHEIVSLPQKRSFQSMDIEADKDKNSISQQCDSSDRPKPKKNPFFTQQESHRISGSPKNTSFRDMKGSNKLSGSSSFINTSEKVNIVSQANPSQNKSSPNKRSQMSEEQKQASAFKRKYSVAIIECDDQLVNCHVKNNDIYGMEGKSEKERKEEQSLQKNEELKTREQQKKSNQNSTVNHQESLKKRLSSIERQNRALLGGYYDAEQGPKSNQSHSQQNQQGQFKQVRVQCEEIDFSSQKPIFDRTAHNQPSQTSTYQNLQSIKGQQLSIPQSIKSIKNQQSQVQVLNEVTTIMQQSVQTHWTSINYPNQFNERQQHQQPLANSDEQEQQQPLSQQQFFINLQGLEYSSEPIQDRFRIFQKLMVDHVNMITLEAEDNIGRQILTNGQYLKKFIKLLLLKHTNQRQKRMFERLLISCFEDKVVSKIEIFKEYRDLIFGPKKIEKVSTEQTMSGRKPNKPNNTRKSLKEEDEQKNDKYSIEVNNASEFEDLSVINSDNRSKDMEKKVSRTEEGPVRRIMFGAVSDISESETTKTFEGGDKEQKKTRRRKVPLSLATGKPTKNAKGTYNTRGRKNKNQDIKQPVEAKPQATGNRKGICELRNLTEGKVEKHPMGSGYTHAQLTKSGQTKLYQVRASFRIFEKSKSKKTNSPRKSKRLSASLQQDSQLKQSKSSSPGENQQLNNSNIKNRGRSSRKSMRKTNQQVDWQTDLLNVDYIKTHFKELEVKQEHMQQFFIPLSQEDKKITKLLNKYAKLKQEKTQLEIERKQVEQEYQDNHMGLDVIDNFQDRQDATITTNRLQRTQQQIKEREMRVSQELEDYKNAPIEVIKIIDPDVNNHGLYAIVELSSRSSSFFGARFFVTPISFLEKAHRKWIDQDLLTIPDLVDEVQRDNIGWLSSDKKILKMIEAESQQRRQLVDNARQQSGVKIDNC